MVATGALPSVSMVIPSYNQREYLDQAIRSVLSQDVDVELLVLDGGSTDGSVEVLQRHDEDLAFWRSAPDGGQAAAIQEGFARASGDVLGWLNSDDLLYPGALRAVLEALRAHPESAWAVGHAGTVDKRSRHLLHRPTIPFRPDDLYNLHLYLPQESTFFRRSVYSSIDGVDASLHYAMDYDLWLQLASTGPPVFVNAYVGCFRVLGGQKSSDVEAYQAEEVAVKRRYDGQFRVYKPVERIYRSLMIRGRRGFRRLRTDGPLGVARQVVHVWRGDQISPGSTRATIVAVGGAAAAALTLLLGGARAFRSRVSR